MKKLFRLRYYILFIGILFFSIKSIAQVECGTDLLHRQMMETDSVYRNNYNIQETEILSILKNRDENFYRNGELYTIPIVVHIIHLGEPIGTGTNISDSIIFEAIRGLNQRWQKVIGDGVIMGFEFCIASRDPSNQPTTGINRVDGSNISNYSLNGISYKSNCGASETKVKDLSKWPTNKYYNIWVVSKICTGNSGYAYYPNLSEYDGTVIVHSSMNYNSTTLTHELGHAFSLIHTFNSTNNDCDPNLDCLLDGDKVCDTPPHKQNDCNTNNPCTNTGNWDNSRKNYLSYCGDRTRFTQDQKLRALAATNSIARKPLLTSLGCLYPTHDDIAITKLNDPKLKTIYIDNCPFTDSMNIELQIQNVGINTINTINFKIILNNEIVSNYNWKGELLSNAIIDIDLNKIKIDTGKNILNIIADSINNNFDVNNFNNKYEFSFECKMANSLKIESMISKQTCNGLNNASSVIDINKQVSILEDFEVQHDWAIDNTNNKHIWKVEKQTDINNNIIHLIHDTLNNTSSSGQYLDSYFYKDFFIPANSTEIKLNIKVKTTGDLDNGNNNSKLLIYVLRSDIAINFTYMQTYKLTELFNINKFTDIEYNISNFITKGSNNKILFRWLNSDPGNNQQSALIDNIKVSYSLPNADPYQFRWSGDTISTEQNLYNISNGIYKISVNDKFGCINEKDIKINNPASINIDNTIVKNSCFNEANGSIYVTPKDGMSPFNYNWSTGSSLDSIQNLNPGLYQLTISDHHGYLSQMPKSIDCMPITTTYCCTRGIYNVKLNNLNKSSSAASEGYRNFTNHYAIIESGEPNIIEVTTGKVYPERVAAWVDFNNDGNFSENEIVLSSENAAINESHKASIEIPNDAVHFTALRLRIMSDYGINPQPCTNLVSGQCEDYTVFIGNPACSIFSFDILEHPLMEVDITGPLSFCEGEAVTLTASNGSNYLWSNGATTQEITVDAPGEFQVTVTDENGCSNVSEIVKTNMLPLLTPKVEISSSKNSICEGELISFNAIPINGGSLPSYQWFVNGELQSETSSTFASYSLSNGANIHCTMTSSEQCLTEPTDVSDSIFIEVNPLVIPEVTISNPTTILDTCEEITFTLTSKNEGLTPKYNWYVNGVLVGTQAAFTAIYLTNGSNIYCSLNSSAPCATEEIVYSDTLNITVVPLSQPILKISNDTIFSSNYNKENYSYTWYKDGEQVSTKPFILCNEYGAGMYYLVVVLNECTIASSTIDIVCSVATGEYVAENNISVFPNPTNEILYIHTQVLVDKIEMYNSTGTYLYDIEHKKVDVSNLHSGLYMLIFYMADGKTIVKNVMVL